MITDYRVSGKTKAPACCNIDCCGTKFGRAHIHHALRPQSASPKRKMRRYARHADKRVWRAEVEMEMALLYVWEYDAIEGEQDEYYRLEFERDMDSDYDDYYDYRSEPFYDDFDYDDISPRYRDVHPLYSVLQDAFHNGQISRIKYHRLVDVLNGRD